MKIRFSTVLLFLLSLFLSIGRADADVTGTWKGTAEIKAAGQPPDKGEFLLNLRQSGSRITGEAGLSRAPIVNGLISGDAVTFDIQAGAAWLTFRLRLSTETHLTGVSVTRGEGAIVASFDLWKIPPSMDVSGTWTGTVTLSEGSPLNASITFRQYGTSITGTTPNGPIQNGSIYGDRLLFSTVSNGVTLNFDLRVTGDQMSGVITATGASYKALIALKKRTG